MKKYTKVQMMAKNAPTGSYAAGCPDNESGLSWFGTDRCKKCERTR